MPISIQVPFNEYTGNGSTTIFAYSFYVVAETDLEVLLDGIVQSSGFTVQDVGEGSGGSVTFSVAPAVDVIVRLVRNVPLDRSTDYQAGAALSSTALDADIDRAVQMIQDLDRDTFKQTVAGVWDFGGAQLENVGTPDEDTDASTKGYVDGVVEALTTIIPFSVQYSQISAIDGTFTVLERSNVTFLIQNVYFKSDSGTITASVEINGTPVTGLSAMAVTSTQGNATASAANTVAVGDKVEVTLSSNVNAQDLSMTIACTKQMA